MTLREMAGPQIQLGELAGALSMKVDDANYGDGAQFSVPFCRGSAKATVLPSERQTRAESVFEHPLAQAIAFRGCDGKHIFRLVVVVVGT